MFVDGGKKLEILERENTENMETPPRKVPGPAMSQPFVLATAGRGSMTPQPRAREQAGTQKEWMNKWMNNLVL